MENHEIRKIVTELGCDQQFPTYIKKLNWGTENARQGNVKKIFIFDCYSVTS